MPAVTDLIGLVEQITLPISGSNARRARSLASPWSHNRTMAGYRAPQTSANSSNRSRAAASAAAV
jgi:hypothetical protein